MRRIPDNTFKAVTWNVYYGTPVRVLESVLIGLLHAGVSIFFMQEAGGADITRMLKAHGLESVVFGQNRIAWNPNIWEKRHSWHRRTSKITFRRSGRRPVVDKITVAILKHRATNKRLKAVSYHKPSHTQRAEWNRNAPNRWRILKDSMALFKRMAFGSAVRHLLFGGDDNIDERKDPRRFRFMLNTGLKQIQAPKPTKGNRKIDDFRIKGLVPDGEGEVRSGGGDHKLFICQFRFS